MALPSNVGYGKVTGRFLRAVLDSPEDPDAEPEGIPIPGLEVTFEASVPRVRNATATPDAVTIQLDKVKVSTDSDGYLVDLSGNQGVYLVASDDPDLEPTGWTWKVTISAPSIKGYSFDFVLPVGAELDLATLIPAPPNPGTQIPQWAAVVEEAYTARDEAAEARDEAVTAAAAAQAVGDTSDAIIAGRVDDSESLTTAALTTRFASKTTVIATDYGATGDGVTDDTDALQEAVDAAIDTGRALYIPSGVYMIRSLSLEAWLYDGQSLSIYGDGATSVIKRLPDSALGNNQRMIYVRGRGHAESVQIRGLKLDGNARENPYPEGNEDDYLWQQNHTLLTSDDETVGSIREVRYEDLVIDDPMADGLSFAGRALGDVFVSRITVPTRTRTRSDVQFSRPVKAAWVTDCDLKSMEMEWVSQPPTPMRFTINNVITDNLDLGAASLGLNCIASLSNVTAAALAAFRGIQGVVRDSTITIAPGNSNEIRSSNGLRFVGCKFLVSSPLLLVHGGGTDAVTAPIFEDCQFIGSAAVIAVSMGTSSTQSIRALFRRCEFSGPLVNSIKSDRSGLVRIEGVTKLVGTTEALHMTATAGNPNRLEWHADPGSSVTATSPVRVNSAVTDLAIVLTGNGWAWNDHKFSGQVPANVVSSRVILADAAPTGAGIAGDVVRLKTPVAGSPNEWVATVSSGSNAGWKVLSTVPA